MHFLFHLIVGLLISRILTGEYYMIIGVAAIIVDIPVVVIRISEFFVLWGMPLRDALKEFYQHGLEGKFFLNWHRPLYRSTHNIFALILFTIFSYLFYPEIAIAMSVAYLSHILLDLFRHQGDAAVRPFFPFSDFHVEGKSWADKKTLILDWSILLVVSIIILLIVEIGGTLG